jgi:hypothetical protein
MSKRAKLDTKIERETFNLVNLIKEHVQDFTILYVRRNGIELDRDSMSKTLEIVRKGVEDAFLANIDRYKANIDGVLTEYTEQENPTPVSKSKKT